MRTFTLVVPVLLLSACGGGDGGFDVSGSVNATLTQSANPNQTNTGFTFAQTTHIDATVPQGSMSNYTGICQIGSTGRTLRITQVAQTDLGLHEIVVTLPAASDDGCTNCQHGAITASVGDETFTGSEQRGTGVISLCTFTTQPNGASGMQLAITCAPLPQNGGSDSLSIDASLTLGDCTVSN